MNDEIIALSDSIDRLRGQLEVFELSAPRRRVKVYRATVSRTRETSYDPPMVGWFLTWGGTSENVHALVELKGGVVIRVDWQDMVFV